jgi:cob(I)alamin adenosyltransferase
MKIYTKTGDDGTTGLFGAGRVSKDDPRIAAYGTVDELNAVLGVCAFHANDEKIKALLQSIQEQLFVLGADLATPTSSKTTYNVPRIATSHVEYIEHNIDSFEAPLPKLEKFILPGGSQLASFFHLARTVARRAERMLVTLSVKEEVGEFDIPYINRLSDLFFVLSRVANQQAGIKDVEWLGAAS